MGRTESRFDFNDTYSVLVWWFWKFIAICTIKMDGTHTHKKNTRRRRISEKNIWLGMCLSQTKASDLVADFSSFTESRLFEFRFSTLNCWRKFYGRNNWDISTLNFCARFSQWVPEHSAALCYIHRPMLWEKQRRKKKQKKNEPSLADSHSIHDTPNASLA